MAFVYDIQIEGDPDPATLKFCDALYLLPEQRKLVPFVPVIVWCDVCQRFCAGEANDSADDIRKQIRAAEAGQGIANFLIEAPDQIRQWVAFWQGQLDCRLVRRSPPKCLACGSTAISHVDPQSPTSFRIPPTGRRASLSLAPDESAVDRRLPLYSLEGEFIGEIPRYDPCSNRRFDETTSYDVIQTMLRAELG